MKYTILSIMILFVFSFVEDSFASGHFTLNARGRTKPQSVNLIGTLGYDFALWGNPELGKENPLYGYATVGTRFGGSPTLSAFVQLAPISPLVLEVERSMTQRFTRTTNFPCDEIECKGRIDRTDLSLRGAAAYKNLVFLGGVLWREIKTMDSATPVMIELEDLVIAPGNHRLFEANVFAGYNLDETQTLGILHASGEIKDSQRGYQSTYAIYRTRWNDYGLAIGAGNFRSDYEPLNGFSAIASITRQWGSRMSLF